MQRCGGKTEGKRILHDGKRKESGIRLREEGRGREEEENEERKRMKERDGETVFVVYKPCKRQIAKSVQK